MDKVMMAGLQEMSWHDGGLFMGMHWLWWSVWFVVLGLLGWAFIRLYSERAEVRRQRGEKEAAEEALRRRFAEGDIDEDELVRRMNVLRETGLGR